MPKEWINSMDHGREVPIVLDSSDGEPRRAMMRKLDDDAIKLSWDKTHPGVALVVLDRENDPDGLDDAARYINLDRDGCNRLIRFLRRARDDAFGRDE